MNRIRSDAAPARRVLIWATLLAASSYMAVAQTAPGNATPGAATTAVPSSLSLDADHAVSLALDRNLALASSRIDTAEKKVKADNAWNALLPSVDVGATLAHWNKAQTGSIIQGVNPVGGGVYDQLFYQSYTAPSWALSASISAQLVLNAALFEGMRGLKLDYEAGTISYDQARRQLERDVRKSFYSLLLLQENMKLMQDNIDAAKLRVDQAEANYKAGLVPELSLLQARVAWENMKPSLEQMRIGYAAALDAFTMTLGLPRGTGIELVGSIDPVYENVSADSLISTRVGERLDIQSLVKTLETLDSAQKAMKLQLWSPSLILGWNADPTFMGDPFKDDLTKGASGTTGGAWQQISGMFRATLSFRLNGLLPQSREAQGLRDMRDSIEKTRAGLAQAIRGSQVEIDSIVRTLQKSRDSRVALELNADLAKRAYDLSEDAYRAGAKDLLEVQQAELELRTAQLQVLTEKFNYVTGLLDLEYAVNLPFGTLSKEGSK
ncbi:MAG TPA: TolC family protein [Rectinemataceae bacterium]|nr:TolC family protein [Rectinemataceae bacterium]